MTESAPFHQLPGDPLRPATAFWSTADDGIRLRLALWQPGGSPARGTVLLFPGRTEYIEKYAPFAHRLNDAGYAVLAIDWRGQGMSARLQDDPRPGHIGEFSDYQRDVIEMVTAATEMSLPRPWHLLAHSMGGCIGLAALHDGLPVESAVFSAPMWGINLRQFPHRLALALAYLAGRAGKGGRAAPGSGANGTYLVDECFGSNLLTSNIDEWCRLLREALAWPELTIGGATFDWVGKALRECNRLSQMPSPDVPMTVSLGSLESIVSAAAISERVDQWPEARLLHVEGARHEVMMEVPPMQDMFLQATLERFQSA
ncbi:alpha/beta hydrolase [Paracoccus sp. Z330]|uniref:Alpha/beta hydrolase n=1 Tax=Paracoccus onchidii TaxID=3017813 RepID=A0ABT4ZDX0_9RHOB|nr:alpha/beta hydrolase [Paracoccus onchidii]MDB6176926.1 alpha/beta hydrolase [Paracoccus onchidii]